MWADLSASLPLQTLAVLWAGAFLGGLAAGGAGFAFGIVASSVWLHAIAPLHATMLVVSGGLLIQIGTIWPLRRSLDLPWLWPFLLAGFIGIPIGVWLLVRADPHALKVVLGGFLALYGGYALLTPQLPRISGGGRAADALVGLFGGILGGVGGYSGVAPAIWSQFRGWTKDVARGFYQPFIVMAHVTTMAWIGVVALDRMGLVLFVIALPAMLLGAFVGWTIYGRLDERRFRQAFAALLLLSGAILIL